MSSTASQPLRSSDNDTQPQPGASPQVAPPTETQAPRVPPQISFRERRRRQNVTRENVILAVISLMIILVVILAMRLTWVRIERIRDQNDFDQALITQIRPAAEMPVIAPDAAPDVRAEAILAAAEEARLEAEAAQIEAKQLTAAAEDAQSTVDLILSFLEGGAVLVGISLGAAAYFGFRNFRELHDDATRVQAGLENTQHDARTMLNETRTTLDTIANAQSRLTDGLSTLETFSSGIENAQEIFSELLLAYQEMRLGNHNEAYKAARRVLDLDANNVQALYLAGWLENQYIERERENALPKLELAVKLAPDWPSARAALGVIQRRRAVQTQGKAREVLLAEAEYNLNRALLDNPRLLDPNLESFWGPVGGIHRSRGEFAEAQKAYERACQVTPGSSYPAGNLAALCLRDSKENGAPIQKAIDRFRDTLTLAKAELALSPSDYFIMMDIAMSTVILSGYNPEKYDLQDGYDYFNKALATDPTDELRSVTARGLQTLIDYCPDEWTGVIDRLKELHDRVNVPSVAPKEAELLDPQAMLTRLDALTIHIQELIARIEQSYKGTNAEGGSAANGSAANSGNT